LTRKGGLIAWTVPGLTPNRSAILRTPATPLPRVAQRAGGKEVMRATPEISREGAGRASGIRRRPMGQQRQFPTPQPIL
jgi:hypothetical protein